MGVNGELGRTQRGSMGLAPIHSAPYTDRGGPITSMSLCGVLQPSYSGPIAAPQPGCPHSHRSQRTWGEMERLGVNGELGRTHRGFCGAGPNPQCAPWKPRGGPIASIGLCGTLQLPYSRPTAGLPSQPLIAEDLGGEMERLGGSGDLGRTQRGFYGAGPTLLHPIHAQGWPHSFYGSLWRSTAAL